VDWESDPVGAANEFFGPLVPGMLGCRVTEVTNDLVVGRIDVPKQLIAGTGYLFAPAVITLADTLCALGTPRNAPDGTTFTDRRAEDELPRIGSRGRDGRGSRDAGARRAHDAGVGLRRLESRHRTHDRSLPQHPDDPSQTRVRASGTNWHANAPRPAVGPGGRGDVRE